jgi:hypothetical protein
MKPQPRQFRISLGAKVLCAAALLAPAASATWSIIAVNTRTGEVCVASATCLDNLDLQTLTPVVRVGLGAACAQSQGDSTGVNRQRIWNDLAAGFTPQQILDDLAANDSHHQHRQYGIVNMHDDPITFSGNLDGIAYYGIASTQDDLKYAIQGNVLTGIQVATNAENSFVATDGDIGQKVMAAMEGARIFGGDGRCSCSDAQPTICGCPPPHFTYSAFTAFFILARIDDIEGSTCDANGCATGQYYCDLRSISTIGGPEPVIDLENQYAAWRAAKAGIVDQVHSRVVASAGRLPADGISQLTVDVELRDIDGTLVTGSPPTLSIADVSTGGPFATAGTVQLVSPGRYRFPLTSTAAAGEGRFRITAQQGSANVLLWPELVVEVAAPAELFCGFSQVSASIGASVPLSLDLGVGHAGSSYLILASASGTTPGTPFAGIQIPLNLDYFLRTSYASAGTGHFPGTIGTLDANGRGAGRFIARGAWLFPLVGRHFDWSAVIYGAPNHATPTDGFDIVP